MIYTFESGKNVTHLIKEKGSCNKEPNDWNEDSTEVRNADILLPNGVRLQKMTLKKYADCTTSINSYRGTNQ